MVDRDFARAGKAARRKGANFELEVRDVLREYGYDRAHRNWLSGGAGGGDLADAIPDVHLECKRTEQTPWASWWKQANSDARPTDLVLVVHRGSSQPIQATGRLTDLHLLMQHLPMLPALATSNVRAVFLQQAREIGAFHPMVIHKVRGDVVATVLFEDFLTMWAPVPERAA